MATAGRRTYHQVINIVGYKHWPRFLDTERRRTNAAWEADKRDLNVLSDGLAALAAKFHKSTDPDDRTVNWRTRLRLSANYAMHGSRAKRQNHPPLVSVTGRCTTR